jgi:hypothetical protein
MGSAAESLASMPNLIPVIAIDHGGPIGAHIGVGEGLLNPTVLNTGWILTRISHQLRNAG